MTFFFSKDIGVDMGTSRIRIFVPHRGVVFDGANSLILNKADSQIIAYGDDASEARERTAPELMVHKVVHRGVIQDQKKAIQYLQLLFSKVNRPFSRVKRDVLSNIPTGVSNVDNHIFTSVFKKAGAKNVFLEKNAILAAFGVKMEANNFRAWMLVDLGAGLTDIGVISLGGLSKNKSVKIAGEDMDKAIVAYVKQKFSLIISEDVAELTKQTIGSANLQEEGEIMEITGSDVASKLPKTVEISSKDVAKAIQGVLAKIVDAVGTVFQETPPEITSDIIDRGIVLTGGLAYLKGIDTYISQHINTPVHIATEPDHAVIRGIGRRIKAGHVKYHKQQLLSHQ